MVSRGQRIVGCALAWRAPTSAVPDRSEIGPYHRGVSAKQRGSYHPLANLRQAPGGRCLRQRRVHGAGPLGDRSLPQRRLGPCWKGPLVGPVIGSGYQPLAHRVVANVSPFFSQAFIVSKSVIEKIPLPNNPFLACKEAFPVLDCALDGGFLGKGDQGMEMVRHEQKQVNPPRTRRLLMNQRTFDG